MRVKFKNKKKQTSILPQKTDTSHQSQQRALQEVLDVLKVWRSPPAGVSVFQIQLQLVKAYDRYLEVCGEAVPHTQTSHLPNIR